MTKPILPQESRIPVPSFAKLHQRKRKVWNKNADTFGGENDETKQAVKNLDALNLEMS